ncbi:MAG TPA: hypothetical protein VK308_09555 [Pyrinomonadaceae bacterium]|nr:hypothetical protein [Pyrinomonadaceae bacterium]
MNELLRNILEAHGGQDRWKKLEQVEATIVTGGGFFPLKGFPADLSPRRMTARLHEERAMLIPFGSPDQRMVFTPERIVVEKLDDTLVAERYAPRDSFAGHQMSTPWDGLHLAYFSGEALWTYFTMPFLLATEGVRVEETEAWREGNETWRVLRAYFPGTIETHCQVQDFFFGEDMLLHRHDYSVNVAGGFGAPQLISDYVTANGIRLPSKRRAFTRGLDRQPILDMLMISIDISEIRFE